jgi:hypothetical protein
LTGDSDSGAIRAEADVFCRYLVGASASSYVVEKYASGQKVLPGDGPRSSRDPFGERLVRFALRGRMHTQLADTYARFFAPYGLLRQKLVLMLAILENSPGIGRNLNSSLSATRFRICVALLQEALGTAMSLAVAVLVLGPLQLYGELERRLRGASRSDG